MVSDKKGPATSLSEEMESKIRLFIEECYRMGIPRCKGKLAVDVQVYLRMKEIHVDRFDDGKLGE